MLPTLRLSSPMMQGSEVRSLQNRLNAHLPHFKVEVDGVFGFGTDKAVRLFQGMNGLQVNGIVNAEVWAKLLER